MNDLLQKATLIPSQSGKTPLAFFILIFIFAIPFWVIGGMTGIQLLPGLPIAALIAVCPGLAALVLAYRENRSTAVKMLLKRAFDYERIKVKIWYIPTLLLMPLVMMLSFVVIRLSGTLIPIPSIPILSTVIMCVAFFISALGEELGWTGYATDPMQNQLGALQASIVLGLIWTVYHFIGLTQTHRSMTWIAWWSLGTVALRVIMVWLYNNTEKSVSAVALFHMTINVTWQLFPVNGSYYDPRVTGTITALVAVIIIIFWDPRNLVRNKKV
ncbi:CPBP family intramembrane glutamic endopeptidase [Stygiobacter electus]|uniref:CPBP family intramembrane metalloprotease n=1 Tax=Stygiobacter electus TaxID=3032292 RepID=A0AAE3P2J9_9BACT|nr:CPBP family intramembrane glutamic endopeptidase [Stygiobacter electus]MDF1613272.1 CPBP family intramembrane metalloprotease [Stygiobacter electus]